MAATSETLLFLRIIGLAMALFAWAGVAFPQIPISWKGGNRAPLSMQSRVVAALAMTCWCLAVFGFYPLLCSAVFAASVVYGIFQSARDREAYDTVRGFTKVSPVSVTPTQLWLALCILDAFFLLSSMYAVVRDLRYPPVTDEQHVIQIMGRGYLVAATIGAVILYFKRPKNRI